MWKIVGLAVLLSVLHQGLGETGCPEPEDIQPCTCTNKGLGVPRLVCVRLNHVNQLKKVFKNSEGHKYKVVVIQKSVLPHIPHDIFDNVGVRDFLMADMTFINMFDRPPTGLDKLSSLRIFNCRITRGISWNFMEPMKNLKYLYIGGVKINRLEDNFIDYVPKGIEILSLSKTETENIKPGTFANFPNLSFIGITHSKITEISRDIFARPFSGTYIDFSYNRLTSIQNDQFKEMPNLNTVNLEHNQLPTIPNGAFDNNQSVAGLTSFYLGGNPLKCDCLLVWLINNKPAYLGGTCVSPKRLAGRELRNLQGSDFPC